VSEERQVPEAEFRSYYGRPILKVTRWKEPHLPAYLFLGELSGAAAVLAAAAAATRRPALARSGRLIAAAAAYGGAGFLTAELGRPERFVNMLRVAKPTSPMSMGSWILAAHSGLVSAAAASEVTGQLPVLGAAAGLAASVTGPLLATYPGVLLANTAVPAWHTAYRELPLLFAGGAMTAAGAGGLAVSACRADRTDFDAARRLALAGAVMFRARAPARPVRRAVPPGQLRQPAADGTFPHDRRGCRDARGPPQPDRGRSRGSAAHRRRGVRQVRRAARWRCLGP
jgi:hypothetical protein